MDAAADDRMLRKQSSTLRLSATLFVSAVTIYFPLTLIINEMERIYKKIFKFLGSIHGPGRATSTSTLLTSTTDLMPSIPTSDAIAVAHHDVTTGVSVSVQYRPSHL